MGGGQNVLITKRMGGGQNELVTKIGMGIILTKNSGCQNVKWEGVRRSKITWSKSQRSHFVKIIVKCVHGGSKC
jgi:hypothetical protein